MVGRRHPRQSGGRPQDSGRWQARRAPLCERIRKSLCSLVPAVSAGADAGTKPSVAPKPQPRLLGKGFTPVLESRLNSLYKDGGDDTDSGMSMSLGADSSNSGPTISGNPGQQLDEEEDGQAVACDKPSGAKCSKVSRHAQGRLQRARGRSRSARTSGREGLLQGPARQLDGPPGRNPQLLQGVNADQGEDALDQEAGPPTSTPRSAPAVGLPLQLRPCGGRKGSIRGWRRARFGRNAN